MTPAQGLLANLAALPDYLHSPVQSQLMQAAENIADARAAATILGLLGRASSYGADIPTTISLPQDHALHLNMGDEWYWVSCNLTVAGSGGQDRIGVLAMISRNRAVSNAVQQSAGWSDVESQIVQSSATVTIASASTQTYEIVRRSPNAQWSLLGGNVAFSAAGEPLSVQCGSDSMSGSVDVLPFVVKVDDGANLTIDLTLTSDLPPAAAYFLQGPGNTGVTPEPAPGIYYSFPQLDVKGSVTAGGQTYTVEGKGWIDHQLLMKYTGPIPPAPMAGYAPIPQISGWSWCQFNLDNGDVFTVAAFQTGVLLTEPQVSYGFYLQRLESGWDPIPLTGTLALDRFIAGVEGVMLPSRWRYSATDFGYPAANGLRVDVTLLPVPWYPDGSFMTPDLGVVGETPVDVALVNFAPINAQNGSGEAITGSGYCESAGWEPPNAYAARALAYLAASPQ